jgi:hypothetical protein
MADFSLGTAELGTSVNLSGLQQGMHQAQSETQSAAGGMGGFFGQAFSFATGGLIASGLGALGGAVTGFFSGAIGDAREADAIFAQSEAVIKSTGGSAGVTAQQVADYASSLSDAAGQSLFGDDQIAQSENLLLTFTNIKGKSLEAATAMSVDMAQAMGGAPKDSAIALGKALNDPIAGITALSRVGVTFTAEQKAQIKTMQEAGDMAGAQGIILKELNKEFGGSAAAAAKADGGMAQLKGRLGEAGEAIGHLLIPVINMLVGVLLDTIIPAIESVVAGVGPFIASFQSAGKQSGVLGEVLGVLGTVWAKLQIIIGLAVQLIQATIVPIFTAIAAFISAHATEINAVLSAAWTIIKTIISTTLDIIIGVIGVALALVQGDWSGAWEIVKSTAATVWEGIKTIVQAAIQLVKGIISLELAAIKGIFENIWNGIKGFLSGIWDGIKGAASSAWEGIKSDISGKFEATKSSVSSIADGIKSTLSGKWDEIKGNASTGWAAVSSSAQSAFQSITGAVAGVVNSVQQTLFGAWDTIKGNAAAAWQGIANSISDAFGSVVGSIRGIVNQVVDYVNGLVDAYNELADTLGLSKLGHIGHVAGGAQSFGGGLAIVGELGPELVALPGGSRVFSAAETRSLASAASGGSQTTTINIDARGTTDPRGVEDAVRRALRAAGIKGDILIRTR